MSSFTYDLNALPAAVMIYDCDERLQTWNDNVALFYPVITPWLQVGMPLAELAERFIDAVYNRRPRPAPDAARVGRAQLSAG